MKSYYLSIKARSARIFAFLSLLAVLIASTAILCTQPSAALAQEPATYEQEIQTGRDFMRRRRYEDALKAFKRANDLKGKASAEAFLLMANAFMGLEAYKNVVQSCDRVIELAANDAGTQAQAQNLKGIALQKQSDGKDSKKLQEAENALRQATTLKADFAEARFNLGVVLMQQNRDADGIAELKQYLQLDPRAPNADQARKMIENPRRAREPFAPDFSITTADGEYISLDDLKGKVVLLDFWATWCGPCVASLPILRELNKKYAKDNQFLIVSVSADNEEETWKAFIEREKMTWTHFFDREHAVARVFNVRGYPTYVLLDGEGVIRFRVMGASLEREAALEDAVKKQIKLLTKPAS